MPIFDNMSFDAKQECLIVAVKSANIEYYEQIDLEDDAYQQQVLDAWAEVDRKYMLKEKAVFRYIQENGWVAPS
jgi:hypothetical protein